MVAPRIRLAQVVPTSLNPFSDFHLVAENYRSPVQFACGRTRPSDEVSRWVESDPAEVTGITEIDGVVVCRQCRRSPAWPASALVLAASVARPAARH